MMRRIFIGLGVLALINFYGVTARAAIMRAGFSFADNAFVDEVLATTGIVTPFDAATVEDAVIGDDLTGVAELGKSSGGGAVLLGFTDNVIVNGPGFDLVLFEEGTVAVLEDFRVSLSLDFSASIIVGVSDTGFNNAKGNRIHVGLVDLTDLGVVAGGTIDRIGVTTFTSIIGGTDLAAAGALNSSGGGGGGVIPEPATFVIWSLLATLGLTVGWRRRRRAR